VIFFQQAINSTAVYVR